MIFFSEIVRNGLFEYILFATIPAMRFDCVIRRGFITFRIGPN